VYALVHLKRKAVENSIEEGLSKLDAQERPKSWNHSGGEAYMAIICMCLPFRLRCSGSVSDTIIPPSSLASPLYATGSIPSAALPRFS
jgi:hypothetical protein